MRKLQHIRYLVFLVGFGLCLVFLTASAFGETGNILSGSKLSPGFSMGVNSSSGKTDWLKNEGEHMSMSYPAGQSWGAAFITVGKPTQPPHPFLDFSTFKTLSIEMRGESGGERLEIGIKTNEQPDDGSETKVPVVLTPTWQTYTFSLEEFSGANLDRLYVITEFVFSGEKRQTVYVRNVKYLGSNTTSQPETTAVPPTSPTQSPPTGTVNPKVAIVYPENLTIIPIKKGQRPSILVCGTAEALPAGSKLFLIVHPITNDHVWTNKVNVSGKEWVNQVFLGGPGGLPENDDTFELFTTVIASDQTLPSTFFMQNEQLPYPSKVVVIRTKVTSLLDRVVNTAKDLQVSAILGSIFLAIGGVVGAVLSAWIGARLDKKGSSKRKTKKAND